MPASQLAKQIPGTSRSPMARRLTRAIDLQFGLWDPAQIESTFYKHPKSGCLRMVCKSKLGNHWKLYNQCLRFVSFNEW